MIVVLGTILALVPNRQVVWGRPTGADHFRCSGAAAYRRILRGARPSRPLYVFLAEIENGSTVAASTGRFVL